MWRLFSRLSKIGKLKIEIFWIYFVCATYSGTPAVSLKGFKNRQYISVKYTFTAFQSTCLYENFNLCIIKGIKAIQNTNIVVAK